MSVTNELLWMRFVSDYIPTNSDIPPRTTGFASSPYYLIPEYWYEDAEIREGAIFVISIQNEETLFAYFEPSTKRFVLA